MTHMDVIVLVCQTNQSQSSNTQGKKSGFSKQWYDSKFKFPCPIKDHYHEIGSCSMFFENAEENRYKIIYRKCCQSCVGPLDKCFPKCSNTDKIPKSLLCQECVNVSKLSNSRPTSVLLCANQKHPKVQKNDLLAVC